MQTVGMPELPEITALAAFLGEHAAGQPIAAVNVASLNVLSTYDPPASALVGRVITGAGRHGKFLDIVTGPGETEGIPEDLHLVIHLARAGWLRWSDAISATPPKMGGPIALRVRLAAGGFDITEAGTKKSVAAAIVRDPASVPGVARLGPDAMSLDRDSLRARVRRPDRAAEEHDHRPAGDRRHRQRLLGRDPAHRKAVAVRDRRQADPRRGRPAVGGDDLGAERCRQQVGRRARPPGSRGRSAPACGCTPGPGLPCPVCGDVIAEVSFADRSFQYCPTCQTGGKKLADRRMSRLVR